MITRAYSYVRILSIDIVIGAIILLRFFSFQANVAIDWPVYVLLGTAVWIIYTVDHIRDAMGAPNSSRLRYRFHLKYKPTLSAVVIILLIGSSALLPLLPTSILLPGGVLTILSSVYLLLHHRLGSFIPKELFVAVVYAAGITMAPLVKATIIPWHYFLLLAITAFINLILFSRYEKQADIEDGFESLAINRTGSALDRLLMVSLGLGLAVSILFLDAVGLYFFLALSLLFCLFNFSDWFAKNEWYRVIGDGVFMLPLFFTL